MPLDHPNADVARRLWSAVAAGDAEALEELLAPGIQWCSVGVGPTAGDYLGRHAVRQYMAAIGERADEFVSELRDLFVSQEGAVIFHRIRARRGERAMQMDYLVRLRIVDGQVVRAVSVAVNQPENDAFWS